jgi:hypothetical protein
MRLIRRLSLLVLLAGPVAGPASAQSLPPPTGPAKAIQLQSTDGISCSEPPYPQSVNGEVNICVDALVKADVQDTPGLRLVVTVLPENDPELLTSPYANRFTSRSPPPGATSWSQQPIGSPVLETAPVPAPPAAQLPVPSATLSAAEPGDGSSIDLASLSTQDRKLARARILTQEEARQRQSRQLQKDLNEQCRQMHGGDLECRSKLKSQKLATSGHRTALANSSWQANR